MSSPPFNKFACFVGDLTHALHDMKTGTSHVYKIYLTATLPTADNTVFNTPPEIAAGVGYTAGGATIGTISGVDPTGVFSFSGATAPTWVASGGNFPPFRYLVLYNSTSPTLPLIGWWDYGSLLLLTNGNTFTVPLPSPILTVT